MPRQPRTPTTRNSTLNVQASRIIPPTPIAYAPPRPVARPTVQAEAPYRAMPDQDQEAESSSLHETITSQLSSQASKELFRRNVQYLEFQDKIKDLLLPDLRSETTKVSDAFNSALLFIEAISPEFSVQTSSPFQTNNGFIFFDPTLVQQEEIRQAIRRIIPSRFEIISFSDSISGSDWNSIGYFNHITVVLRLVANRTSGPKFQFRFRNANYINWISHMNRGDTPNNAKLFFSSSVSKVTQYAFHLAVNQDIPSANPRLFPHNENVQNRGLTTLRTLSSPLRTQTASRPSVTAASAVSVPMPQYTSVPLRNQTITTTTGPFVPPTSVPTTRLDGLTVNTLNGLQPGTITSIGGRVTSSPVQQETDYESYFSQAVEEDSRDDVAPDDYNFDYFSGGQDPSPEDIGIVSVDEGYPVPVAPRPATFAERISYGEISRSEYDEEAPYDRVQEESPYVTEASAPSRPQWDIDSMEDEIPEEERPVAQVASTPVVSGTNFQSEINSIRNNISSALGVPREYLEDEQPRSRVHPRLQEICSLPLAQRTAEERSVLARYIRGNPFNRASSDLIHDLNYIIGNVQAAYPNLASNAIRHAIGHGGVGGYGQIHNILGVRISNIREREEIHSWHPNTTIRASSRDVIVISQTPVADRHTVEIQFMNAHLTGEGHGLSDSDYLNNLSWLLGDIPSSFAHRPESTQFLRAALERRFTETNDRIVAGIRSQQIAYSAPTPVETNVRREASIAAPPQTESNNIELARSRELENTTISQYAPETRIVIPRDSMESLEPSTRTFQMERTVDLSGVEERMVTDLGESIDNEILRELTQTVEADARQYVPGNARFENIPVTVTLPQVIAPTPITLAASDGREWTITRQTQTESFEQTREADRITSMRVIPLNDEAPSVDPPAPITNTQRIVNRYTDRRVGEDYYSTIPYTSLYDATTTIQEPADRSAYRRGIERTPQNNTPISDIPITRTQRRQLEQRLEIGRGLSSDFRNAVNGQSINRVRIIDDFIRQRPRNLSRYLYLKELDWARNNIEQIIRPAQVTEQIAQTVLDLINRRVFEELENFESSEEGRGRLSVEERRMLRTPVRLLARLEEDVRNRVREMIQTENTNQMPTTPTNIPHVFVDTEGPTSPMFQPVTMTQEDMQQAIVRVDQMLREMRSNESANSTQPIAIIDSLAAPALSPAQPTIEEFRSELRREAELDRQLASIRYIPEE